MYPSKRVNTQDTRETLVHALDDLLECYLNLLDHYQTLQQVLAQLLSKGYLSLAQANFSNPNYIRYGQECYDGRMQASARLSISRSTPSFSILDPRTVQASGSHSDHDEEDTVKEPTTTEKKSPPSEGTKIGSRITSDPLNWFGILVPTALRISQGIFKNAVADVIPALASVSKEMRDVEIEVRRTRKKLREAT